MRIIKNYKKLPFMSSESDKESDCGTGNGSASFKSYFPSFPIL